MPALLPFLAAERGYSYAALGALVLFSTIGSSIIQPLFGLLSDRFARPWLMPAGLVMAGLGIALAGPAPTYALTALAVVVSGLGVAAFHPEGAKFAGLASRERQGRGMSLFSVGGNAGFALGPLLTTPLVLLFGLSGTLALALFPLAAGVLIARELGRLRALESGPDAAAPGGRDDWGAFSRLGGMIALRSGVYFGLQAFIPAYFVVELSTSEAAGNAALTLMLAMGAVGTLVGGGLVDRWGARTVLVGTQVLLLPLLVVLPLAGTAGATVLLGLVGFVTIASFSITIVLGQAYLPSRVGLASGHHAGARDRARRRGGDRARRRRRRRRAAGRPVGDRGAADSGAPALAQPARRSRRRTAGCADGRCREQGKSMTDQRRSPRVQIEMPCTLHRRSGSPIEARTVDLGPGGMRVCTKRPLAADETLRFELQGIDGRARVLRQQSRDTYAVRFEMLAEPALAELHAAHAVRLSPTYWSAARPATSTACTAIRIWPAVVGVNQSSASASRLSTTHSALAAITATTATRGIAGRVASRSTSAA